eukprot:3362867-Prymnesium_polylepis.1
MTYITIIGKTQNGPTLRRFQSAATCGAFISASSSRESLVALSSALHQAENQRVAGGIGIMRPEPCSQIRHARSYG